jgi:hypothetical protein
LETTAAFRFIHSYLMTVTTFLFGAVRERACILLL